MVMWLDTPDAVEAIGQIEQKIVDQGWNKRNNKSLKSAHALVKAEKDVYIQYLILTYPGAAKNHDQWYAFLQRTIGTVKEWPSQSKEYSSAKNAIFSAVAASGYQKMKMGEGLDDETKRQRGCELTDQEKSYTK